MLCYVMLGQCVLAMCAIFRICENQSQPELQLVENLATPLEGV